MKENAHDKDVPLLQARNQSLKKYGHRYRCSVVRIKRGCVKRESKRMLRGRDVCVHTSMCLYTPGDSIIDRRH